MECNKEEAIRAKGIAEKKMENKDFVGARKIAVRAKQLYADLENIGQIVCVCDVHCSAENKTLGNEKDWYGILQLEQSADEALIKKQYRKLALLLHPDKNKFAGAEAAFKLIGEAQRVLLDKEKRSFYDARYKRFHQSTAPNPPHQTNKNTNTVRPPRGENSIKNNAGSQAKRQPQQQAHSGPNGRTTFWTLCPFCAFRYEYYMEHMNVTLRCQACKKPFVAYDMCPQWVPTGSTANHAATNTRVGVSNQGVNHSASSGRFQGNSCQHPQGSDSFANPPMWSKAEVGVSDKGNASNVNGNNINRASSGRTNHSVGGANKRGKKRVSESSESFQSESSTDNEDEEAVAQGTPMADSKSKRDSNRRRSSRLKRNVSYSENVCDDENLLNNSKKPKGSTPSSSPIRQTPVAPSEEKPTNSTVPPGFADEAGQHGTEKVDAAEDNPQRGCKVDNGVPDSSSEASEVEMHEVPDPDFSDFDQLRKEDLFKAGQIWAVYDTADAMPRFYALIRKVFSSGFKLRITWFEPDPDEEDARQWVDKDLPFSCGKFKHGGSQYTEDRLMFSHLMLWQRGREKNTVNIYPVVGETWALFKDWNMGWMSDPDNSRKYQYEYVEVLSTYVEGTGVHVALLGKVKGFTCLYCQTGKEMLVPPGEILKFAHRIPSYKMMGTEREGVPLFSFELDPAAINLDPRDASS